MAKAVDIKNFRGFASLSAPDCRRINIVVGENGSGKTALLEALFLVVGASPELALRSKSWRGYDIAVTGSESEYTDALWGDLFHNFEIEEQVWIRLSGSMGHNRTLRISQKTGKVSVQLTKKSPITVVDDSVIMRFHWKGPGKYERIDEPALEDGKLRWERRGESPIKGSFFAANHTYSTAETVNRFSTLSKQASESELIVHFTRMFPMIEDLSIEMSGGSPMVFAKTKGIAQKIPINLISGGMSKLASILFAIPKQAGGIVLVDEIENGFFYKRLPAIWESLLYFANMYDVQIFASTHSQECLSAVAGIAHKDPDSFSLIRTIRQDGRSIARQFSGSDFASAIDEEVEVR